MNIFQFIATILFFGSLFLLFRNGYTYKRMEEARELIHKYCRELIDIRQYNVEYNYYKEMKVEYFKYLFNLSLWGTNSAIKKEFQYLFTKES